MPSPDRILDLLDVRTGLTFPVVGVPEELSWLGWGTRQRCAWEGEEGPEIGVLVRAHPDSVEVERRGGARLKLPWGATTFLPRMGAGGLDREPSEAQEMAKAAKLKAGQRWITVHPNGPGESGVPVLIQQNPDGTHRIIGGAGGKLTHLILKNVGPPLTPEEKRAKAKEKREKEREKEAVASPEEKKRAVDTKAAAREARQEAQRAFVEHVRTSLGGVREDITPEQKKKLEEEDKLKPHQIKAIERAHERAQYKEAKQRAREVVTALTAAATSRAEAAASVGADVHDPTFQAARELAGMLEQEEQAASRARTEARQTGRERLTGGDPEVSRRAAEATLDELKAGPDEELVKLGERGDAVGEVAKRATAEAERARALAETAEKVRAGQMDATAEDVVRALGDKASTLQPDEIAEQLVQQAGAAGRKAEIERARMEKLSELHAEDPEAAWQALEYADNLQRMARERGEAVRAGLVETVMVGARDVDHAEARKLAQDFLQHQKAMRELKDAERAMDGARIDAARRAFELDTHEHPEGDEVQETVDDEVRRELTERLLGMAAQGRGDYQEAVGAGHHDGLADVALGISGQRHLDRLAVDALGLRNASVLARYALEQAGHKPDDVLNALEQHHVAEVTRASAAALDAADKVAPGLRDTVETVGDFERAAEQLKLHERDIKNAQQLVGSTIGRLEATATLAQTFRGRIPDTLSVDAKRAGLDRTLAWLQAAGLRPGDYLVDHTDKVVTIPQRSWGRLILQEGAEETALRHDVSRIKRGEADEEGWLPAGIVRREASTFTAPVPDAPTLAEPLNLRGAETAEAIQQAVERHAGLRLAEGEHPADVMSDLLSTSRMRTIENRDAYVEAVRAAFPVLNAEGRRVKLEEHAAHFQGLAERAMRDKYGSETGAFHAQDIRPQDPLTREAMFRTLAEHPDAAVAFKPVGELDHQDKRVLRQAAYQRMGIDPKVREDEAAYRQALSALGPEPDPNKGTMSMFGPRTGPSPEWQEWKREQAQVFQRFPRTGLSDAIQALGRRPTDATAAAEHDLKVRALEQAAAEAPTAWSRFVETHGSLQLAQQAIQDEMKGRFVERFRDHYGKLTGQGLRLGVAEVTNPERHIKAVASPEEAEALQREAQSLYAGLRARQGGQFAAEGEGAVKAKYTRFLEQETVQKQNQLGMFSARAPEPKPDEPAFKPAPPETGKRYTVGQRAEAQIASLIGTIGKPFEPGKPIGLIQGLNMDGPRAAQQRTIKQLLRVKRMGGFLGTGSGKSLTSIGGFTEAHARGEATHGLYLVPSAVQAQFGAEMLRYTQPGAYTWATGEGKSHEERVAMLKDPSVQMRVFTHQSFRDTALRVMADHHSMTPEAMRDRLQQLRPRARAQLLRDAFDAQGIPRHYTYYDEAHTAESGQDGDASTTHLVRSAVTHPVNATHYLHGTGTPVKNNTRELASVAEAIDPERYADRAKFVQDFGQATAAAHGALRRELAPRIFTAKIEPEGVVRRDSSNPRIKPGLLGRPGQKVSDGAPLELEPAHRELVDRVQSAYETARKARSAPRDTLAGPMLVDALRTLTPRPFERAAPEEHAAIAERLLPSLGVLKEAAMRRAINQAPPEINTKLKAMTEVIRHDLRQTWTDRKGNARQGRAAVVFTDSKREADMIHAHLASKGVRAALYHGGLNAQQRDEVRLGFQPEGGAAPKYDVIVATSSAEAGVNLQRASVIHHFDVPQTAKSHQQRSGRAHRQGQLGDVDIHDWHTDTDYEKNARARLRDKAALAHVLEDPIPHLDEHGIAGLYRAIVAQNNQAEAA